VDVIPIGTIVAYGGPLTDADKVNLRKLGWLPCDGSLLKKREYIDLALKININYGGTDCAGGCFNLPDLRGRFVRGTDHDDASAHIPSNTGCNKIGYLQLYATAKPNNPFITTSDGLHDHQLAHAIADNHAYAIAGSNYGLRNDGRIIVDSAGSHTQAAMGGFNTESKPVDHYVNYIIKYQGQDNAVQ
jgi:microcystin-dependent protein